MWRQTSPTDNTNAKHLSFSVHRGADLCWALGGIICNFTLILPYFQHWGDEPRPRFFSVEEIKWRKKKVFAQNGTLFFPEFRWRPQKKSSLKLEHVFPRILEETCAQTHTQARSQKFAMGGLFWRSGDSTPSCWRLGICGLGPQPPEARGSGGGAPSAQKVCSKSSKSLKKRSSSPPLATLLYATVHTRVKVLGGMQM